MVRPARFRLKAFLFLLVLIGVAYLAREHWLAWVARPLVRSDGPVKADLAVVLGGDLDGKRIDAAIALVRGGYVPKVLVSGPPVYDGYESDVAIAYAVHQGCPRDWFVSVPHQAHSTKEEAAFVVAELCRMGVHRILLVTNDYHTARAARIFQAAAREAGAGLEIRTVAAPDHMFRIESWWHNREGQKTIFVEWCKTLANAFGM